MCSVVNVALCVPGLIFMSDSTTWFEYAAFCNHFVSSINHHVIFLVVLLNVYGFRAYTVSIGNWNVGLEAGKAIWLEVQISCHLLLS